MTLSRNKESADWHKDNFQRILLVTANASIYKCDRGKTAVPVTYKCSCSKQDNICTKNSQDNAELGFYFRHHFQ